MGNDSTRDPKRTKCADVLDEVEPRLCWGRSSDSRRVGGHDVGGFVKPDARLCEEGHSEQPPAGWKSSRSFWCPEAPCPAPEKLGRPRSGAPLFIGGLLAPKNLTPTNPSIM